MGTVVVSRGSGGTFLYSSNQLCLFTTEIKLSRAFCPNK